MGTPFGEEHTLHQEFPPYLAGSAAVPPPDAAGVPYVIADAGPERRGRRGLWIAVMAIAAVVLLGGSAFAYVTVSGQHNTSAGTGAPDLNAPGGGTGAPAASVNGTSTDAAARDSAIPESELRNATLDLPAWPATSLPCPTQKQKFSDGHTTASTVTQGQNQVGPLTTSIGKVVYADVNHDGSPDTVARVTCTLQGADHQVVAFQKNKVGDIVLLGQVVGQTGDIHNIFDIAPGANGSVAVEVGDMNGCCGWDPTMAQHQRRMYYWAGNPNDPNDKGFQQTEGPTSFPPNLRTTSVAVTTGELAFGALSNGLRHGSLNVMVHNNGPGAIAHSNLVFRVPNSFKVEFTGCTTDPPSSVLTVTCPVPALAAGASWRFTYKFGTAATPAGTGSLLLQDLKTDQNQSMRLTGSTGWNVTFTIRTA